MVRKKLIKMFSILGIAVTLFFGYSFYNDLNKEEVPQTISIENCKNVIEEEDSIIEEVKMIGRIEIMQCQIGKKITISNDALLKCFNKKSIIVKVVTEENKSKGWRKRLTKPCLAA